MDMKTLMKELRRTLVRYRAGMISLEQCKQEAYLLAALMKAYELTVIEERIDRLEAARDTRRYR